MRLSMWQQTLLAQGRRKGKTRTPWLVQMWRFQFFLSAGAVFMPRPHFNWEKEGDIVKCNIFTQISKRWEHNLPFLLYTCQDYNSMMLGPCPRTFLNHQDISIFQMRYLLAYQTLSEISSTLHVPAIRFSLCASNSTMPIFSSFRQIHKGEKGKCTDNCNNIITFKVKSL